MNVQPSYREFVAEQEAKGEAPRGYPGARSEHDNLPPATRHPPSAIRLSLLFLILAAFVWRVHGLTHQSLWRDEVDAIYFALRELPTTLAMFVQAAQNGPLYYLALRPWFYLVGASEFALRYPSALAGVLTIPLLWQVAHRLVGARGEGRGARSRGQGARGEGQGTEVQSELVTSNDQPGTNPQSIIEMSSEKQRLSTPPATRHPPPAIPLLAATFFALNPYQLWYGQEGKMYAVITCLALLATWFWLKGVEQGGASPWLGYLITVSLAMYTHLLMVLIIPLHLLWFLIAWPQSRLRWRGYGLALAGLTLPYLPMVWWHWAMLTATEKQTGFTFTPLVPMLRTLLLNHSRGFLPGDNLLVVAPLFFLGLAGLVLGIGELSIPAKHPVSASLSAWRRMLLIITWLIVPVLSIYIVSLRQPVFTDRYVIWVAPAAMIMLALGVTVVQRNASILGPPLAALLVLYILGFWLYSGWQQKSLTMKYDLRSAVRYVAERRSPETLLILQIPHMEWGYRYYSGEPMVDVFATSEARLGRWVGGLWTNGGAPNDQARREVDQQMQQITAGVAELWVLRSEVEMWDARHLMDEWLDQHGQVVEKAEYLGTQVKRYSLTR